MRKTCLGGLCLVPRCFCSCAGFFVALVSVELELFFNVFAQQSLADAVNDYDPQNGEGVRWSCKSKRNIRAPRAREIMMHSGGCEPVINNLIVSVVSGNFRANPTAFSHHSHICGYVSVPPPRSRLDNWWQLQFAPEGGGLRITLAHMMFSLSQTEQPSHVCLC